MLPGGLKQDDYDILEFLWNRNENLIADPKTIAVNTGIGHDRVNNRIRVLLENGLLQREKVEIDGLSSKGLYRTTDVGNAFASGDMTISELRELIANRE